MTTRKAKKKLTSLSLSQGSSLPPTLTVLSGADRRGSPQLWEQVTLWGSSGRPGGWRTPLISAKTWSLVQYKVWQLCRLSNVSSQGFLFHHRATELQTFGEGRR